jgi:hypothetical protein
MMPVPGSQQRQEWPQPNKPMVVMLVTKAHLEETHAPAYKSANLISIPKLRDFWAKAAPPAPVVPREVDVTIDISEKAFQITKGGTEQGFHLVAGMPTAIRLRNSDLVAHEFVSTLFHEVTFRMSGNATVVKTARASGVRLDPGQSVTLEFNTPTAKPDAYGIIETYYDVFWCNVHGKQHGDKMRGDVMVLETRGEVGGG